MKTVAWLVSLTFLATTAVACGGGKFSSPTEDSNSAGPGAGEGATGSIGLELVIPSGQTIPVLDWAITGPNNAATVVQSGVALSESNGAMLLIGNIPPGQGYEISMSGTATDGSVTCTGSAYFAITARTTTQVSVPLACSVATSGSHVVLVDGTSFYCAAWDNVSASPTETSVGSSVVLSATAAAPIPGAITYAWSAPNGTFSSPNASVTNFTCTTAGVVTVTLVVGDGPVPAGSSCDTALSTTTVPVTCD